MTKRGRIILAVVTLAVLIVIAWSILKPGPPDPIYGGHRLSYWVSNVPPNVILFGSLGPPGLDSNAVPYLVRCLKARDGPFQKAYLDLYPHLPAWIRGRLSIPIRAARRRAVAWQFLASLGETARPAIPELVQLAARDGEAGVRLAAIIVLSRIAGSDDPGVIAGLVAASKDKDADPLVRAVAADALRNLNSRAPATAAAP